MTAKTFALCFVIAVLVAFNHFVLIPMGYNLVDLALELF